ncbi:acetyl-coenzyme A carboxylase carboxyltransferase subunit beta [Striga asiatica]|uniref:Acetyl-coenzyme A carboxylase carboxyltransferase subunit beta n=1 Tax=Striga asiatica TaxID=4170 RepID=A0A5A7P8X0_STRAF|nr:acetyl-coenzyme A carboxylase carboxyltransferase subunit beta [Striga asiatica]
MYFPAMFVRGNRFFKQSRNTRSAQFPVLFTFLILIVFALVLLFGKNGDKSTFVADPLNQKWDSYDSIVRLNPKVELRNGTDFVWQIPDSPKAVLFLAHGCSGKAVNFWDKSPNCPNCIGLPEERLIVLHALARKFAVLAVSSKEICWSLGDERLIVKDIIRWWTAKQKLDKLPLFALGASSGGYFVSVLANEMKFKSIALMIAEGVYSHLEITKDYPSTLFVHMPKDGTRKWKIEKYLAVMREKGIDVAEVKCSEFPLMPHFFANRIPGVDFALSEKLFGVFKEKGFLDENGYLRDDGRAIPWRTAIEERNIILPDKSLVNHIQEEMNLAFAYHEMTSVPSEHIFYWFESHMN